MLANIKDNWRYLIFSFFIVSISAWFIEIFYSILFRFKFVLPGTLTGPWCPIYGITFLFLLICIDKKRSPILNFIIAFILAGIIEYLASYISEEIFNNVIWDYSNYLFNINGRICLRMSLIFASLGFSMIYYIESLLRQFYLYLGNKVNTIDFILTIFFICDILINIFFI